MGRGLRVCGLIFGLGMALCACRSRIVLALPAPSVEAQMAMDRASLLLREGADTTGLREALQDVVELAPEWEVPRRRLDDLQRRELLGPRALRDHWMALEKGELIGLHAYLSGRLNVERSAQRFLQANRDQPRNPWGLHGLAFVAAGQGRFERAMELETQALGLAREPEERRLFVLALSSYAQRAGQKDRSVAVLRELWKRMEVGAERDGVELELAIAESTQGIEAASRRAKVRANRLMRSGVLSRLQMGVLMASGLVDSDVARAWLLLRSDTEEPEAWAREFSLRLLGTLDADALGARSLQASEGRSVRARTVELFAQGQTMDAWKLWRFSMPDFLDDILSGQHGFFHLKVSTAVFQSNPEDPEFALRLAKALMERGWLEEAQAFIRGLPTNMNVDEILRMEARATLALESLQGLGRLMRRVDRGEAHLAPGDPIDREALDEGKVDSLDDLLRAVAQVLWSAGPYFYGDLKRDELEERLVASPRLRFGPFAQVVHPGPVVAPWDSDRDLGEQMAPVPGLATELSKLGRVGVLGSAMGNGPPDASILRLVYSEQVTGEHLGVPFQGTVLWCDGTDVGARNVRMGASVAGAALHEGYFIDLHEVRVAHEAWQRLANRFQAGGSEGRLNQLREILSDPGLPTYAPDLIALQTGPVDPLDPEPLAMDPWLETGVLLGQANRNRLAWMGEHAQEMGWKPGSLAPPSFEDAVLLTAIHEEGHLCERTRFLPLSRHWPAVLGFLADQNLSPIRIQQRFEYRAQLTALCAVRDPRLALVEILDLAEGSTSGLPHGPAYAELLKDLVQELGAGLKADAPWLRGLKMDPDHRLVFQLHRLPKEALLATALRVAAKEGLVAPGYLGK